MRTSAGTECGFYYEDFQRGAARQECRIPKGPGSQPWRPDDCARCPVPSILLRNDSPDLGLRITIAAGFAGTRRRIKLESWCERHAIDVEKPEVGCPQCTSQAEEILRRAFED